jgi:hypothetical protein
VTALLVTVIVLVLLLALWLGYAFSVAVYVAAKTGILRKRDGFVVRREKQPAAFRMGLVSRAAIALLLILIASAAVSMLIQIAFA